MTGVENREEGARVAMCVFGVAMATTVACVGGLAVSAAMGVNGSGRAGGGFVAMAVAAAAAAVFGVAGKADRARFGTRAMLAIGAPLVGWAFATSDGANGLAEEDKAVVGFVLLGLLAAGTSVLARLETEEDGR